ncbi:fatty acid oxidation complex subunit alpha FadJ [Kangiella sediminilitoris]|uniref:enoyl-CoA hydratase n=1 Tax=Kangiella sediminilitoris TaxID=1144748 RepID=A0A1B3B961_9GAMM|nr:fatty acid oxidation complex subunit alpha FadJ [Kangiella sediminilitoris]AOE49321.1 fatty-acid oxidation protein subunit alpha [Kangiella sediminilitoris]
MSDNTFFTFEQHDDGIAVISIDLPGESQNVLKMEFIEELQPVIEQIKTDSAVKGLIIKSGKEGSFIAGADISMFGKVDTAEDAEKISTSGHQFFNALEDLKKPVVAAIHGACLGGGLELALACSGRVISDSSKTKLGLPEVQLGVLPGGGGTQRLPRLVGIAPSLDMMLTGKQLFPKQAKKLGLVDDVVPQANLMKAARKRIEELRKGKEKKTSISSYFTAKGLQKLFLESNPLGRNIIFDQARKTVQKKTKGNYPAPNKIIECVEKGMSQGIKKGLATEAKNFGQLVVSSEAKALISVFYATTELKKDNGVDSDAEPARIKKVGVLGGGLMGSGIAYVSVDKANKKVRVKDVRPEGVNGALNYSWKLISKKMKKKIVSPSTARHTMSFLTGTTDFSGFKNVDMVIEAVFEDIKLKHQMVKDVEQNCSDHTIFATNTSSIPITTIAEAAKRPEQVVGLHYFSPVEKMPLVEIIATDKTADWVIATCVELAKQQGKTPIVVNDGAGFYVNRILAPYINEAGILLNEGVAIEKLDKAMVQAGFPVGPITLLDQVGIDVATKVAPILEEAFGDRMSTPRAFEKLKDDDRKGKKNKRGFYKYEGGSKNGKEVDESVYSVLGVTPDKHVDNKEIAERGLLLMANEAARCLDEGIIRSARDGDIGAIFGIGFPPFHGGPFRYMDKLGIDTVVERLEYYQKLQGDRFAPADILIKMRDGSESFHK